MRGRLLLFLTDYSIYVNDPETQFVMGVTLLRSGDDVCCLRRAGAEMGIPTLIGNESADMPRVKATSITTQNDGSP
jgi:hypothetical protein